MVTSTTSKVIKITQQVTNQTNKQVNSSLKLNFIITSNLRKEILIYSIQSIMIIKVINTSTITRKLFSNLPKQENFKYSVDGYVFNVL
jgi:hypothetical protein